MTKLQLSWTYEKDGRDWTVDLKPLSLIVYKSMASDHWEWELNVVSDVGKSTIYRSTEMYATPREAQYAAEQCFGKMVGEWPGIEIEY